MAEPRKIIFCNACRGRVGETGYGSCYCTVPAALSTPAFDNSRRLPHFSVRSDGTSGEDWVARLRSKQFAVTVTAEGLLRSIDFQVTSGVASGVYVLRERDVAVAEWSFATACDEAERIGLRPPNSEVACLLREALSDQDIRGIGLQALVVAHPLIYDSLWSRFGLLGIDCYFNRCLCAEHRHGAAAYRPDVGFAFVG